LLQLRILGRLRLPRQGELDIDKKGGVRGIDVGESARFDESEKQNCVDVF
jgi:hypothetical protein